jgi:tetratricopeptide (TPR) repeat protein
VKRRNEELLYQADDAHKKGHLQEAKYLYRSILRSEPLNAEANYKMGIIESSAGRGASAISFYRQAVEANPEMEQFWLSLINALISENQIEQAKKAIKQSLKRGFDSEDLRMQAALASAENNALDTKCSSLSQDNLNSLLDHYQSGRFDDALALASSMTIQHPREELVWKVLGAVLQQKGELDGALNAFKRVIELNQLDAELHSNLSVILCELNRFGEAEESCRQAILLRSDFAPAHNNLAIALLNQGLFDDAKETSLKAIALIPDFSEAYATLGSAFSGLKRFDESLESYERALELNPLNVVAHNSLGLLLQDLGMLEQAEVSFRRAISLQPNFSVAHNNLGNVLKNQGKLKEAEHSFKRSIDLTPSSYVAYCNLGVVQRELERLDEAEESFVRALEWRSDYADAQSFLGITLQEAGKLDEAEKVLSKAIVASPNSSKINGALGCIKYEKGDPDVALKFFKKAFNLDPSSRINELRLRAVDSSLNKQIASDDSGVFNKVYDKSGFDINRLITHRPVEPELVRKLYQMKTRTMDTTKDTRYGNGLCSYGFELFDDKSDIIKMVTSELSRIMIDAVGSNIYILDSFFNILTVGGGGTLPHKHLKLHDNTMDLWKKKYSLVYYLTVGDQDCKDPGILKLYSPDENILPSVGMVVIVPATRLHSAVYGGAADRVMIGVNFYAI